MYKIGLILLLFLFSWCNVFGQASETEDNYCVEFDGVTDNLDLGEDSNLFLTYFTMEFWIYPYSQASNYGWQGFCGNQISGLEDRSPCVLIYKNKGISYGFSPKEIAWRSFDVPDIITMYAWNHVAVTFDGIDYFLYVNGTKIDVPKKKVDNAASNYFANKNPKKYAVRYFGRVRPNETYRGMIDDIRIWSYARSQQEIEENMKELLSGDEAGLIGYWTFNDQQRIAKDKTPRGNDGTLVGANVRFVKMPLGDEDAMYVLRSPIATQTLKVDQQKDTIISWTFGHKPNDKYKLTLSEISDPTKARITLTPKDYGDSIETKMSIKGLKEGMITAKLAFDYGKYHIEHNFLIDVKSAEVGKLSNHTDIGKNAKGELVNGTSLYSDGIYTILDNGGVVGTSGNSDGGTFVSWDLTGDGDFQTRILNQGDITATAAFGLGIREDLKNIGCKSFGVYISKGNENLLIARNEASANNSIIASSLATVPTWLRINRAGNVFTAYTSTDPSANWVTLGTTTIDMKSTVNVGLLVGAGNDDGARKRIIFDNVSLTGSLSVVNPLSDRRITSQQSISFDKVFSNVGSATIYKVSTIPDGIVEVTRQDMNIVLKPISSGVVQVILYAENGSNKTQNTFNVEVGVLKESWMSVDIWKTPALASGKSFVTMSDADKIRINSVVMDKTASDVTTTTVDGITFVAQKKSVEQNDRQVITAYVKEIGITGSGVRAGLMFRAGLDNNSVQVGFSCTAYEGLSLEYRWLNNVVIEKRTIKNVKPPCWLKLTNYKGAYNAYYSTESETTTPHNWHCVLGNSLILQMTDTSTYAGVFSNTNSYHEGLANFTNVSIKSYDGSKIACTRTDVVENTDLNPSKLKCYPNPFNGSTKVEFANLKKGKVDVRLYNSSGMELATLYSGVANAGLQTYSVDLSSQPAGMYYCKVITTSGVEVVKLMQIK